MEENNVILNKEVSIEESEEARKHIQVLGTFKEGEDLVIGDDNTTEEEPVKEDDNKIDKVIKRELRDKYNVFENVFGQGYGQRFAKVMNANIIDRFWLMDSIISYAHQDSNLNDYQKRIMDDIEDAFREACCIDGPSKRLINILNKKPNLYKMTKESRINRTYDSISLSVSRLGFNDVPKPNYIPLFFTSFSVCFGWKGVHHDFAYTQNTGTRNPTGLLMTALLSKYANGISPYDWSSMWFVLSFIKNLSVCSVTKQEVFDTNPEIKTYGDNLLKLADMVLENCGDYILKSNSIEVKEGQIPYDVEVQSPKSINDNVVEVEI